MQIQIHAQTSSLYYGRMLLHSQKYITPIILTQHYKALSEWYQPLTQTVPNQKYSNGLNEGLSWFGWNVIVSSKILHKI